MEYHSNILNDGVKLYLLRKSVLSRRKNNLLLKPCMCEYVYFYIDIYTCTLMCVCVCVFMKDMHQNINNS